MSTNPSCPDPATGARADAPEAGADPAAQSRPSRREFLTATAAGLAGASFAPVQVAGLRSAAPAVPQNLVGDGRRRRILLRGGVVLTLDTRVGDFERADVLIDGKLIADIGPNISAADAEVVDCSGTIVMPGFITTHHHQYETLQRSVIADGLLQGAWPQESYGSVVQNIWTAGRIAGSAESEQLRLGSGACAVRSRGLLHLRARRLSERDQRRHHDRDRHVAGQPLP